MSEEHSANKVVLIKCALVHFTMK